jgi:transcriptional regulator with XRE-family HTH domain
MLDSKEVLESIAKNVKLLRKRKKLTLEELSIMSNVHINYLSRLEKSEANISISKLVDICNALEVHVGDILPSKHLVINTDFSLNNEQYLYDIFSRLSRLHKSHPYFVVELLESLNKVEGILHFSSTLSRRDLSIIFNLVNEMNKVEVELSPPSEKL